jgi:hypothetical protein
VVPRLVEVLGHALRSRLRPVDPKVSENPNSVGVDALRLGAGRTRLEVVAADVSEECFGELAAGRIPGADEENAGRSAGHRGCLPGATRSARGANRQIGVDELGVEPVEVGALAPDGGALLGDERSEVGVDVASLEAQPGQRAGDQRPQAQLAGDQAVATRSSWASMRSNSSSAAYWRS